ncbi:MFS transporter [Brachymonas chironomi]|uniref:MFS transporter n=1 Tax=Brachymonas chironomi TaxID=491919 RepID=UPI00039FD541|nr:MFS transporter [Brachymonas chironomi]
MFALLPDGALRPGVRRREVFGWALYDFANSGYTTVVLTAVFSAYFVSAVAGAASWATLLWTLAIGLSNTIVMLLMPALGAWADQSAAKKRLLMLVTLLCVLSTAALALAQPGMVLLAVLLTVISNMFYSMGESLTAAFLPELAQPEAMGRVSGLGWGLGYAGGMLTLAVCLAFVLWAQAQGMPAGEYVAITMLITAALYGLPALGTFALLREHAQPRPQTARTGIAQALGQLRDTWAQTRQLPDLRLLLGSTVCYQAGVAVAITLAAIYAEQVIGFESQETMIMVLALNLAAALGALLFGQLQDRIGHRLALGLTLLGWIAVCLLAASATGKPQFWVAATVAGLCMGSSQSAGRAMVGLFAPPRQLAEYFGLWTTATRLASILGPISYGLITWVASGNQRVAILACSLFFVAGLAFLWPMRVQRGRQAALAA